MAILFNFIPNCIFESLATTFITWGATKVAEKMIWKTGSYIVNSLFQKEKYNINEIDGWSYIFKDYD